MSNLVLSSNQTTERSNNACDWCHEYGDKVQQRMSNITELCTLLDVELYIPRAKPRLNRVRKKVDLFYLFKFSPNICFEFAKTTIVAFNCERPPSESFINSWEAAVSELPPHKQRCLPSWVCWNHKSGNMSKVSPFKLIRSFMKIVPLRHYQIGCHHSPSGHGQLGWLFGKAA